MPTATPADQNLSRQTLIASPTDHTRRQLLRASLAVAAVSSLPIARRGNAQELEFEERTPMRPSRAVPDTSADLSLDGQAFKGPTGAKDMEAHHDEVIRFENGKMSSSECERWGFKAGKYQATRHGQTIRFSASLVSEDYGRIDWAGEITNGQITATYHWRKERLFWTLKRSYWFDGSSQG